MGPSKDLNSDPDTTSNASDGSKQGDTAGSETGLGVNGDRQKNTLEKRYTQSSALLIGIGECYGKNGFPTLPNAERDVGTVEAALRGLHGEFWRMKSLVGESATRDAILRELAQLFSQAAENDKVIIYFAGHGVRHETSAKSGWVVPADGQSESRDPAHSSWVRLEEFAHAFDECRAKHIGLFMDCCYGGRLTAIPENVDGMSADDPNAAYAEALLTKRARIVITSGLPDEGVTDGSPGTNSPFASALADALKSRDGLPTTGFEVFTHIRKTFIEQGVKHLPVIGNPPGADPGGDLVFFPR